MCVYLTGFLLGLVVEGHARKEHAGPAAPFSRAGRTGRNEPDHPLPLLVHQNPPNPSLMAKTPLHLLQLHTPKPDSNF